jgi:hypothetical protein
VSRRAPAAVRRGVAPAFADVSKTPRAAAPAAAPARPAAPPMVMPDFGDDTNDEDLDASGDDGQPDPEAASLAPASESRQTGVVYTERFSGAGSVPRGTGVVTLEMTLVEDIDQLWDWVRADRDGTTAFLGHAHRNTQSFFNQVAQIGRKEKDGVAWLRSIKRAGALVGFVILDPIQRGTPPVAHCHIYIAQEMRGSLPDFLPSLLAEGDRQLPGVTLFVATNQDSLASILKSVGFTSQIVLTRPSPATPV